MSTNVGAVDFELLLNSNPFNKGIQTAGNTIQKSGIEGMLGKIGKAALAAFSVKAVVDFTKSCLELGSNLTEVQNVVDVTFGNLNTQVDEFAKNAIDQFGLGQTVTKKYVGTFGAMAKAFDFNNQAALEMSETLTGLVGDVASFYNLSSDEAFTKLKSVFTGETETLKDLGIVMTQTALDQYALENGFGKTTSAMTEQEKTALRYQFVLDKLSLAQGDFARTSDSWANQTRVLSLRFDELKATLGQGFINLFTPIVQGINWVISKLQVLADAFKSFTEFITGNKSDSSGGVGSIATDLTDVTNSADTASDAVSGIGESAKKTQKQLLGLRGIDEINNLTTSSDDSSSGSSGIGNLGGVDFGNSLSDTMQEANSEMNAFMQKALPQAIGCLLLSLIALLLMTARYKIILFDNEMMIYEWKVAAMLPTLIPYQNIQTIQKKSKHHIIVEHQKTSHIYVFNSDAFLETYNEFTQEDKTNENE